jgi:hypothetical protein
VKSFKQAVRTEELMLCCSVLHQPAAWSLVKLGGWAALIIIWWCLLAMQDAMLTAMLALITVSL